ncbi:hypothetical protein RFI_06112 [Reticulomyxa filosa]|uniref:Uncharacterized protein n=1 Tax=Reticulomyxa filosa TaxID=46433 RepID=X6NYP0_RETFI|nr:hypothetical protein RFI_06112 [Reticulomyxa filosa]|eukprot:ETO31008.1 hypothetical protein RFI_06112 [Reticulomyxa filosa]
MNEEVIDHCLTEIQMLIFFYFVKSFTIDIYENKSINDKFKITILLYIKLSELLSKNTMDHYCDDPQTSIYIILRISNERQANVKRNLILFAEHNDDIDDKCIDKDDVISTYQDKIIDFCWTSRKVRTLSQTATTLQNTFDLVKYFFTALLQVYSKQYFWILLKAKNMKVVFGSTYTWTVEKHQSYHFLFLKLIKRMQKFDFFSAMTISFLSSEFFFINPLVNTFEKNIEKQ